MSQENSETPYQAAHTKRVNVLDSYEIRDWAKWFGCSHDELRRAVTLAGTLPEKVGEFLKRKK